MPELSEQIPSTPEPTAAYAQTRTGVVPPAVPEREVCTGEGTAFRIGRGVERAVHAQPYERKARDPLYRPLHIYTTDPELSRLQGAVALINVPYEPLKPGPVGRLFAVDNYDGRAKVSYTRVDLEAPENLIRSGRTPSPSDHQFHQQMVYAVCSSVYAAFRSALGRHVAWGFDNNGKAEEPVRLRLCPHACDARNAFYDRAQGALCFGYYRANEEVVGTNLPHQFVFTCLSHDIIVHEVTHALLDGLRAHLAYPSNADVLAFHEAFADLVAIFQHFSYEKVVQSSIRASRGNLFEANLLTDLARQFGHTTGRKSSLRSAIQTTKGKDGSEGPTQYDPNEMEPHALGSVLVSAVFDAFETIFRRKTEVYLRLATGGTAVLPPGELPADLQTVLAKEASQLASHFLTICIRAIDYCPPVDIKFGDFLRAVITADYDLVPDDPWGYREAWITAFRKRGIYPPHVQNLSEDALLWRSPRREIPPIIDLNFARLQFDGDPGRPANVRELRRQACVLGQAVSRPEFMAEFGLAPPGKEFSLPVVESIRSSRRVGPDGQVVFDLIAEVTQRRTVTLSGRQATVEIYGGATIILSPRGEVRYVISKNVRSEERATRLRDYIIDTRGAAFWQQEGGQYLPIKQPFRLLHDTSRE